MSTQKSITIAVAGFLLGSAVTLALSKTTTTNKDLEGETTTNAGSPNAPTNTSRKITSKNITTELPQEIRDEQLSRNELYFGTKSLTNIKNSSVLVIGLGGVGSHTAHMLARAGVGYLRLIDFDQVTLSSLNRHACATLEDVGVPKVVALKHFLEKVCPDKSMLEIDARVQMYTGDVEKDGDLMDFPKHNSRDDGGDGSTSKSWDIVIDAIDDVPTKARLLAHCVRNDIRVISCMGAGGKSDFTRLHVSDLRTASRDPLATKLRQTLKKILKKDKSDAVSSCLEDVDKVAVVYSSEKTVVKLADFTEQQKEEGIHKYGAMDNMRIRVIPVLGTMPAIMGQSLAAMTICELGGKRFSPMSGERVGRNVRHKLFQHLKNREKKFRDEIEAQQQNHQESDFAQDPKGEREDDIKNNKNNDSDVLLRAPAIINGTWVGPAQIDADDVEYVFAEVWRNRCCVTGETLGTVLEISRWDMSKPSNCQNLVLLGVKAMKNFDQALRESGDGRDSVPEEIRKGIEARLTTCQVDSRA